MLAENVELENMRVLAIGQKDAEISSLMQAVESNERAHLAAVENYERVIAESLDKSACSNREYVRSFTCPLLFSLSRNPL